MNFYIYMLGADLLNNPGALAGIILAIVVAIALIVAFIIMLPKIKKSVAEKRAKRVEEKEQRTKNQEKAQNYASSLFNQEEKTVSGGLNQKEISSIVDTVQHKRHENAKVELEKKEIDNHNQDKVNDVISVLKGGISSASAYKKADAFEIKKEKEKEEENQKKMQSKVDNVLGVISSSIKMTQNNNTQTTKKSSSKNSEKKESKK